MKTKGFFWHIHHDILLEWSDNIEERFEAVRKDKPKNEIKTRLRLIKPVDEKLLPIEFAKAYKAWDKAWNKARAKAWDKARAKADKARVKYKPEIEALHAKECGCREWDGTRIIFGDEGK